MSLSLSLSLSLYENKIPPFPSPNRVSFTARSWSNFIPSSLAYLPFLESYLPTLPSLNSLSSWSC